MARIANKLTARGVVRLTKPGRYSDGAGLFLFVGREGRKSWVLLYRWGGRTRELGLGSARPGAVSLAEARERTAAARRQIRDGIDPAATRAAAQRTTPTFGEAADELIASLAPSWKNGKHTAQWQAHLTTHAAAMRSKLVDRIDVEDVLRVLRPLWSTKPTTAALVRTRIEAVIDAATARGHRSGPNPATWKGGLAHLLPKPKRLTRGHNRALPLDELPGFMRELGKRRGVAAQALAFCILTATRAGEALGARWDEIDLDAALWTIPASRMKAGTAHRIPLPPQAIEILDRAAALRQDDLVFPGARPGHPLSDGVFLRLLQTRMKLAVTAHGFRSCFKQFAAERTDFANEVSEASLAHAIGSQVERAYRRTDMLDKRRALMIAWAKFCLPGANVVTFPKRA